MKLTLIKHSVDEIHIVLHIVLLHVMEYVILYVGLSLKFHRPQIKEVAARSGGPPVALLLKPFQYFSCRYKGRHETLIRIADFRTEVRAWDLQNAQQER